jgi:two-component system KDP operon response regulator KdpE
MVRSTAESSIAAKPTGSLQEGEGAPGLGVVPPVPRVLIIDRDPGVCRHLEVLLKAEDYAVIRGEWGRNGEERIMEICPDVIILDYDLPDSGGLALLSAVRVWNRVPVLMLSTRDVAAEKVRAFDCGANDFVVKPFDGSELLARVRLLIRQKGRVLGSIVVRMASMRSRDGWEGAVKSVPLELTGKEEAIFRVLADQRGTHVPCRNLLHAVWGRDSMATRHELRVYIAQLRRKLENCGAVGLITSERNIGYCLSVGDGLRPSQVEPMVRSA